MSDSVLRGQVWFAAVPWLDGEQKPFVIVSNNVRNKRLNTYLAARITTSHKQPSDSIMMLLPGEPVVGSVICDDIELLYREDLRRNVGGLTVMTMARLDVALRAALGIQH